MGHDAPMHKTRFHSISDIPDELVMTHSRRDPNNPFYQTRKWVNVKKRQILFGQKDGVPTHLRTPGLKLFYYSTIWLTFGTLAANLYLFNYYVTGKDKKK